MKLGPRQKQWVKDLRSGKYPKTVDMLIEMSDDKRHITGFCCLGVYAHTQNSVSWDKYPTCSVLDRGDWLALGLRNEEGTFNKSVSVGGTKFCTLAEINDNAGKTHKWMAVFIEKNADNIFERPA